MVPVKRDNAHNNGLLGIALTLCLLLLCALVTTATETASEGMVEGAVQVTSEGTAVAMTEGSATALIPSSEAMGSMLSSGDSTSTQRLRHQRTRVTVPEDDPDGEQPTVIKAVTPEGDTLTFANADSIEGLENLEVLNSPVKRGTTQLGEIRPFNPDPTRALWLSALCPGLGQIYNRRYWKLPIVVGAFIGLGYGTAWNNRMLTDYSQAYRDIMDDDPNTRSYMDFYPPTTQESDLDKTWLTKTLRNKRDYYRRYRDICIIGMVALYLVNILDAYVDASLAHFDISPDLSMDVTPAVLDPGVGQGLRSPSLGMQCAITF